MWFRASTRKGEGDGKGERGQAEKPWWVGGKSGLYGSMGVGLIFLRTQQALRWERIWFSLGERGFCPKI